MVSRRFCLSYICFVCFILPNTSGLFGANTASAQSITLSVPAKTLRDADEYFTDVLHNPKDFDSICDIGFDLWKYSAKTAANGIWTGKHSDTQAPIAGILPVPTMGTNLAVSREDCGELALFPERPVDASKYSRISWKAKTSAPSILAFLWSHDSSYAIYGFYDTDGYNAPAGAIPTPAGKWAIHDYSIPELAPANNPWSGSITGISLWPSAYQPPGGETSFDWIRLIDENSSPALNISWNYAPGGRVTKPQDYVAIYADDNQTGYDGSAVFRSAELSGSANLRTGILPPGVFYFYAALETTEGQTAQTVAQSAYRGPVVINGKPVLKFTAPSRMSGAEYARDELGNAWDMNESSDLANLTDSTGAPTPPSFRGFHDWRFENGFFHAVSDHDSVGGTVDTQVYLRLDPNKPINTNLYRYFCYRMQVDAQNMPRNGDPALLNAAGWVARLIWVRQGAANGFGSSAAHELVEKSMFFPDYQNGLALYCFDLWDESGHELGPKWQEIEWVTLLRFDPIEATPATGFVIDSAGLYAENKTSPAGIYNVSWTVSDPENDSLSISLYYGSDSHGQNGELIDSLNNSQSRAGTYTWDASNVSPGKYYIWADISDGINTSRSVSEVHVKVASANAHPTQRRSPCDFDGDRITDLRVVRGAGANHEALIFTRKSATGAISLSAGGSVLYDLFLDADIEGDQVSDSGFVGALNSSAFGWFYRSSYSGLLSSWSWGIRGDIPLTSDIDGDGLSDITVFRPADGTWWSLRTALGVLSMSWGLPGDMPVLEDFDGDSWEDVGIYRPSIGFWAILKSTRGASPKLEDIIWKQWGLPGDHPMPGDYDGDQIADLVVFRPAWGLWLICSSKSGFDCSQGTAMQFGLPGDYPIKGDFDGDGTLDFAVWRPNTGVWFYRRSSDGQIEMQQFGLPGDWPLCAGIKDTMAKLGQ